MYNPAWLVLQKILIETIKKVPFMIILLKLKLIRISLSLRNDDFKLTTGSKYRKKTRKNLFLAAFNSGTHVIKKPWNAYPGFGPKDL